MPKEAFFVKNKIITPWLTPLRDSACSAASHGYTELPLPHSYARAFALRSQRVIDNPRVPRSDILVYRIPMITSLNLW